MYIEINVYLTKDIFLLKKPVHSYYLKIKATDKQKEKELKYTSSRV